jgi:hypothetical protein
LTALKVSDRLQKDMKTKPFFLENESHRGIPLPVQSPDLLWSKFEKTGSIAAFLAYVQRAENTECFFGAPKETVRS